MLRLAGGRLFQPGLPPSPSGGSVRALPRQRLMSGPRLRPVAPVVQSARSMLMPGSSCLPLIVAHAMHGLGNLRLHHERDDALADLWSAGSGGCRQGRW